MTVLCIYMLIGYESPIWTIYPRYIVISISNTSARLSVDITSNGIWPPPLQFGELVIHIGPNCSIRALSVFVVCIHF